MSIKPILLLIVSLYSNYACAQKDTTYWPTGEVSSVSSINGESRLLTLFYKNGTIKEERTFVGVVPVGQWLQYYPSGTLMHLTIYSDGYVEFTFSSFYENGQPKSVGVVKNAIDYEYQYYFENGVIETSMEILDNGERVRKQYYRSGALKEIATYNPYRTGTWKTFYETGELQRTEEFSNNIMIGVCKEYYKNQKLKQTEECVLNTQYRDIKEFHPNGKLKRIGRKDYWIGSNGRPVRAWEEYHDNGQLYKTYQFDEGMKTGHWKTYHRNGALQEIGQYNAGKPIGFWQEFYDTGALKNTGKYAENVSRMEKSGVWTMYHKNGNVKRTSPHGYRGLSGEAREYYRNGNLKRIEHWACDYRDGQWEYYRRNGKLKGVEDQGVGGR